MAKFLTLLFEVTALFDMRTRTELVMLQKTMVVVEGVARSFHPKLDMWATAEPVVREWVERHLGPAGRLEDAAQGAGEVGKFFGDVPGLLGRAARDHRSARCRNARRAGARARNGRGDRAGRGARQPLDAHCALGDRRAARGGDLEDGLRIAGGVDALTPLRSFERRDIAGGRDVNEHNNQGSDARARRTRRPEDARGQ